jgi:hypothetical protein
MTEAEMKTNITNELLRVNNEIRKTMNLAPLTNDEIKDLTNQKVEIVCQMLKKNMQIPMDEELTLSVFENKYSSLPLPKLKSNDN